MDVVTGSLFGIIFASLTFYILDLTGKEYLFSKPATETPVREDSSGNSKFWYEQNPGAAPTPPALTNTRSADLVSDILAAKAKLNKTTSQIEEHEEKEQSVELK